MNIKLKQQVRRNALITGVGGQDGFYLVEWLLQQGYEVYGIERSLAQVSRELKDRLAGLFCIELTEPQGLADVVRRVKPQEVYHLAAHHFSSQGSENRTDRLDPFWAVNLLAANVILEVFRQELKESRFFYAASAHIFGVPEVCPQTEWTRHRPNTLYGISKSAGVHLCRYYRESYGLHVSAGILFNHESPRRSASFVTTQLACAAAKASVGRPERLIIRDLEAVVDWGAAQDYVKAMWLMLQQPSGDDYVISSGIPRTVREFAETAFASVKLVATEFVFQDHTRLLNIRTNLVGYIVVL